MCSRCHDFKLSFFDYIKKNNRLNQNANDQLFICGQCKRIYKFNYPMEEKKINILYNIFAIVVLLIAYIFGHKYIPFIELFLIQFQIEINPIVIFLIRITEYFFWVFAFIMANIMILSFIKWKLAISTEAACQDKV